MTAVVFIIGPSRSGSSVLAQALGRHPRILATEELHYYNLLQPEAEGCTEGLWARLEAVQHQGRFFDIKNSTLPDLPTPDPADLPDPDVPLLPAFFDRLAQDTEADAVVEQTPMNLYYRDVIRADFAAPLFVMMRRDPRAMIASQKMRWRVGANGARKIPARDIARVRHAGHPILQLALLRKTLSAMAQADSEPDVLTVSYEHLVTSPEAVLADLAVRLGLEYDPAMREVSDAGSSHTVEGQRRGFDPTRLEGWRTSLTQTEIWLIERLCTNALVLPATGARPRLGEALWLVLRLPWSMAVAFYYSAGGYGNLIDAVRRRLL